MRNEPETERQGSNKDTRKKLKVKLSTGQWETHTRPAKPIPVQVLVAPEPAVLFISEVDVWLGELDTQLRIREPGLLAEPYAWQLPWQ